MGPRLPIAQCCRNVPSLPSPRHLPNVLWDSGANCWALTAITPGSNQGERHAAAILPTQAPGCQARSTQSVTVSPSERNPGLALESSPGQGSTRLRTPIAGWGLDWSGQLRPRRVGAEPHPTRMDRGDHAVCQAETLRRVPRSTRSLTVLARMLAGPVECGCPARYDRRAGALASWTFQMSFGHGGCAGTRPGRHTSGRRGSGWPS